MRFDPLTLSHITANRHNFLFLLAVCGSLSFSHKNKYGKNSDKADHALPTAKCSLPGLRTAGVIECLESARRLRGIYHGISCMSMFIGLRGLM